MTGKHQAGGRAPFVVPRWASPPPVVMFLIAVALMVALAGAAWLMLR